jgi:hypothetical protein
MKRCININEVLYIERSWIYLQVLFESLFSVTKLFQHGVSKFCGYVGTNACVEFCNFVQCHICVSYVSDYYFIKGVLNIRYTNTAVKKYSRLCRPINLFIFRIYNMG